MMIKGLEKWGDKVIPCELGNGNIAYYVNFGLEPYTSIEVGIWIKDENKLEVFSQVDEKLISVILQYRGSNERLRFWYGDRDTGKSWNEEFEVLGRIGRSSGTFKVPLVLNNSRSCYGGSLMFSPLVRIDEVSSHRTLWKVPNFHVEKLYLQHTPVNRDYPWAVMQLRDNGDVLNVANFKTDVKAKRWIDFMNGKRYSK